MSDFPAAHSMDTDWFAVDADGNVGIFNSYEGGAVPHFSGDFFRATRIDDVEDFCKLLPRDEEGIIHLKTEGKNLIKDINLGNIPISLYYDYSIWLVFIISSEEAVAKLKTSNNLVLRFAGEPITVYVDQVPNEIINKMVSSGEILGGKEFRLWEHPHCLGLFFYDNDYQIPAPYYRSEVPEIPLKLEDLSEDLKIALCTSNFENVKFTETEIIQPIEHTPCATWRMTEFWVDSQGNERNGFEDYQES